MSDSVKLLAVELEAAFVGLTDEEELAIMELEAITVGLSDAVELWALAVELEEIQLVEVVDREVVAELDATLVGSREGEELSGTELVAKLVGLTLAEELMRTELDTVDLPEEVGAVVPTSREFVELILMDEDCTTELDDGRNVDEEWLTKEVVQGVLCGIAGVEVRTSVDDGLMTDDEKLLIVGGVQTEPRRRSFHGSEGHRLLQKR